MRRRRFFGALLTGAAALVVAPALKAEAAPMGKPSPWGTVYTSSELAQARVDAWRRSLHG